MISYFSYLRNPRKDKLVAFFIFAWLAIAIKHLGGFYFVICFLTVFLWRFLRFEKPVIEMYLAALLG